jgi:glycine oxidase
MTKIVNILGAGLMGRMMALVLRKEGFNVHVFDKHSALSDHSAAYAAAAMLAPLAESVNTEICVVEMGQYSLKRWPDILKTLSKPVYFQQNGTLLIWHQQDHSVAKHLGSQLKTIHDLHPSLPKPEFVEDSRLHDLEPSLGTSFAQGIFLPEEGQLDNRGLLNSLLDESVKLGVNYHWNSPREISQFITTANEWVVDCRGLGAKPSWEEIRGVRGEVIRIHAPEVNLSRPVRLIHPRYPIYIAPKPGGIYVIGATEIESEDLSPVSVRSTLELLSAAYTVHSGFAEARILESRAQCRPTLPDNLPALMRMSSKVLKINGLYRHGFMISPAVMDAALELIVHDSQTIADQFHIPVHQIDYAHLH